MRDKHSNGDHPDRERINRSLDYLRKRSQYRLWWSSARIALGRAGTRDRLGEHLAELEPKRTRVE